METLSFGDYPRIPGYEPLRWLGINGGRIYLARQSRTGKLVVLRVYELQFAHLIHEHEALLARLDHPGILRVYEIGESLGHPFSAVEYSESTLAERLRQGPLSNEEVAHYGSAIAAAIQYARGQGMICVDLSPTSVLISPENVPKLHGFEPAEGGQTPRRRMPGSPPRFWAPEEFAGEEATASTHVWRIGVLLYTMSTGRPPFDGASLEELAKTIAGESPVPPRQLNPAVDRHLESVCLKCLEKQPKRRYASLKDLIKDLARISRKRG